MLNGTLTPPAAATPAGGAADSDRAGGTPPGVASALTAAPFVPEDAPFDADQRQWLNGFLSGLTVLARAASGAGGGSAAGAAVDAPPITIAYGSQSGNSESLSKQLRKRAAAAGFAPAVVPLHELDAAAVSATKRLLVVTSTHGEGDPPDNAKAFCAMLEGAGAPSFTGVDYSVCALGDRSYTHFCRTGRVVDERIAELGGTRAAERVECDVDYEDDFAAWADAVFASGAIAGAAGSASAAAEPAEAGDGGPRWDKKNPFPATVISAERVSGAGSTKDIRHVEISLAGSGLRYEPGDALGVMPVNCPGVVGEVLGAAGLSGRETVEIRGEPMALRTALLRRLDIGNPTHALAERLGLAGLPPADDNAAFRAWLDDRHTVDLVASAEEPVEPAALSETLRPLQPRLYSISSSPRAHPGEVHLTVGVVRYETHGRPRLGVASTFLADRCPEGGLVGVYVASSPHFRPPAADVPLIMIGPGTGVAPFRAFLEDRRADRSAGLETADTWLFFGDRTAGEDFIYREELEGMLGEGVLSRLDTAWSRDGDEKVYVQDRIREHGERFFSWLERGAAVYVCGDAKRMAPDVERAIVGVVGEHGGLDEDAAAAYVARLAAEHRYQRDVY